MLATDDDDDDDGDIGDVLIDDDDSSAERNVGFGRTDGRTDGGSTTCRPGRFGLLMMKPHISHSRR